MPHGRASRAQAQHVSDGHLNRSRVFGAYLSTTLPSEPKFSSVNRRKVQSTCASHRGGKISWKCEVSAPGRSAHSPRMAAIMAVILSSRNHLDSTVSKSPNPLVPSTTPQCWTIRSVRVKQRIIMYDVDFIVPRVEIGFLHAVQP